MAEFKCGRREGEKVKKRTIANLTNRPAEKIGLDQVIAAKRCKERDLVVAMIAEGLIHPCSKPATTRLWHTTTLAGELGVEDAPSASSGQADEDDLYEAMDWLLAWQKCIERKLASRHLVEGGQVLYQGAEKVHGETFSAPW